MTMEEALEALGHRPDRATLEIYISRAWVRPLKRKKEWHFEVIDIERVRLVHHFREDMRMDEDALDLALHLLDQVYGLREQMRRVHHAIGRQPEQVQQEILALLREAEGEFTDV